MGFWPMVCKIAVWICGTWFKKSVCLCIIQFWIACGHAQPALHRVIKWITEWLIVKMRGVCLAVMQFVLENLIPSLRLWCLVLGYSGWKGALQCISLEVMLFFMKKFPYSGLDHVSHINQYWDQQRSFPALLLKVHLRCHELSMSTSTCHRWI